MFKRFLVIAILMALPATVMGRATWTGAVSDDFANAANYTANPVNAYQTEETDFGGAATLPVKYAGYTGYGFGRLKGNGLLLTQIDGVHEWVNGAGSSRPALALFRGVAATPAQFDLLGGTHILDYLMLGYQNYFPAASDGYGLLNIWGTGTMLIRDNPFASGWYGLEINAGSLIDIRDSGALVAPVGMYTTLTDLEAAGKIVAGQAGYSLAYNLASDPTYGDQVVVTAVPEPASLLLLAVGGLLLRRRGT